MAAKIAVIGLGQFGIAIARRLAFKGVEVMAIDKDQERVDIVKDDVAYAVALDSTDIKALKAQNITEMDAVMLAIGENIEGLLLTTVHLQELGVKRIVARAMSKQQRMILEKLGVKEIFFPEEEAANIVAEAILNPNVGAFLSLPDEYQIAEIRTPRKIAKKSVGEAEIKDGYNLKIVAIKRTFEDFAGGERKMREHLILSFNDDTIIQPYDALYILGKEADIVRFMELNS
ncbi:MAG: TrkA family potassium uptake protein [Cytophagales bacterium]|nr:TrkA family potassium uptake protein [Cytophagales bacterium]MDW8384971.1 TrkA family potassium uptake protein [Flammeovirgaceae bacterium]